MLMHYAQWIGHWCIAHCCVAYSRVDESRMITHTHVSIFTKTYETHLSKSLNPISSKENAFILFFFFIQVLNVSSIEAIYVGSQF